MSSSISTVGAGFTPATIWFPNGTVPDGLSSVAISRGTTRIYYPRPGEVSPDSARSAKPSKDEQAKHTITTFGFAYVNELGRQGFTQKPFAFPVGTMIVRERLPTLTSAPDVLVVMIKHERNFNRKANGWEFLTVSGDATKILQREKEGKCLKCHAQASKDDFVFPEEGRQP